MAYWLLQGDPARYRMLAAALDHLDTTWSARQSSDKIQVGDKVVFWMSGEHAGAYALGEVTAPAQNIVEDPTFVPYWVDPSDAGNAEARIRARQDRLLVMYPVLRKAALEDPALQEMLVIKRPAGTVFPMSEAQYRRIVELADSRPVEWPREELILALDFYLRTKAGTVSNRAAGRRRLGRLCDRSADAYEFRSGNFKSLDSGKGFPNVSRDARDVWEEFAGDAALTRLAAQEIETGLLEGGGVSFASEELRFVRSVGELRLSVARFNRDANKVRARSSNLARQTTYWVHDDEANSFGPAKLVAFANLRIERYDQAVELVPGDEDPVLDSGLASPRDWVDLPADPILQRPAKRNSDGTHTTLTLALEMTRAPGGATLDEIDAALADLLPGKEHKAALLLRWMSRERGWGFHMDPATRKISLLNRANTIGRIDGNRTRRQIEKVVGANFQQDPALAKKLEQWATALLGGEVFRDGLVSPEKWKFVTAKVGDPMPVEKKPHVAGIYEFLERQGLRFPTELVTTYLLSLKTKPFVILSGISGTGKTKLAQAVAEWAGVEERTVQQEEPQTPPDASPSSTWIYQLKPYNFDHRKIVVAKEFEDMFDRPETGTTPLVIHFDGKQYKGGLGAVHSHGRLLHELRLGATFTEKLAESLQPEDYVRISVRQNADESQEIRFERVEKRIHARMEVIRRYDFISVRPDWLDGKEVLGFYNVLTEDYVARPFLRLLLQAHRDAEKPYFAILDEMNLARVEHYFADLLSATESRKPAPDGIGIEQEPLHLHDLAQCIPSERPDTWDRPRQCASCRGTDAEIQACPLWFDGVQLIPRRLKVPANIHVTGTVNIDETTHQFSPKVLDRANVIEFNRVDLAGDTVDAEDAFVLHDGVIDLGKTRVATFGDFETTEPVVRQTLRDLNAILEPFNMHFGYRVANEISLYVKNAKEHVGDAATWAALDLQVLQKVLPKLHGSKQRLLGPLWRVLLFVTFGNDATKAEYRDEDFRRTDEALGAGKDVPRPGGGEATQPRMPRSARKLARMLRLLRDQGFVSFIE